MARVTSASAQSSATTIIRLVSAEGGRAVLDLGDGRVTMLVDQELHLTLKTDFYNG